MTERAWTLGYPPAYEKAVRMEGNMKAPGGIVFTSAESARAWAQAPERREEKEYVSGGKATGPWDWEPYEIELPTNWDTDVSSSREKVWNAFHAWHMDGGGAFDTRCGICMEDDYRGTLPHWALVNPAALINPDTGMPA